MCLSKHTTESIRRAKLFREQAQWKLKTTTFEIVCTVDPMGINPFLLIWVIWKVGVLPKMSDYSFKSVSVISRGVKSQELDTPAIEKRFAYTFLQQLITYVDQAQQHMMEFGETLFQWIITKLQLNQYNAKCMPNTFCGLNVSGWCREEMFLFHQNKS